MDKEKIQDIMDKWSDVNSFIGILSGYCSYNMNIREIGAMQPLLDYIYHKNSKLYEDMEHVFMKS